jgi:hypothetical protein
MGFAIYLHFHSTQNCIYKHILCKYKNKLRCQYELYELLKMIISLDLVHVRGNAWITVPSLHSVYFLVQVQSTQF